MVLITRNLKNVPFKQGGGNENIFYNIPRHRMNNVTKNRMYEFLFENKKINAR